MIPVVKLQEKQVNRCQTNCKGSKSVSICVTTFNPSQSVSSKLRGKDRGRAAKLKLATRDGHGPELEWPREEEGAMEAPAFHSQNLCFLYSPNSAYT